MKENVKRSMAKSITFRVLVILSNSTIVYLITGRIDETLGVIVFTSVSSTILYYLHERIWNKVEWS